MPAFLLIETALGASSSYVTVGGALAGSLWFGAFVGLFQWSARWLGDAIALPWLSENGVPLIVFLLLLVPIVFALKKPISRVFRSRLSWFLPEFVRRETGRDMSVKYKETARGGLAVNVIEC